MQDTALWFLDTRVKIVVSAASGSDRLSVIKHWAPCGDSPPLHVHDTEDEVFHILSGKLRWTRGGETLEAGAGETLMLPKGVPHTYCVDSAEGAQWLTVTSPGDFEALVRAASRPATAPGLPRRGGHPTPEQAAHLAELCERHHIRLVGEPLAPRSAA